MFKVLVWKNGKSKIVERGSYDKCIKWMGCNSPDGDFWELKENPQPLKVDMDRVSMMGDAVPKRF